jgi:cytochrome c oxidase subunit 1
MTGRMYPESLAKVSAALVFLGFNGTFFPQFVLGYMGCRAAITRIPMSSRC